jgi:hypothetical protein
MSRGRNVLTGDLTPEEGKGAADALVALPSLPTSRHTGTEKTRPSEEISA